MNVRWLVALGLIAGACGDDGGNTTPFDARTDAPVDAPVDADTGAIPRIEPASCRFEVDPRIGLTEGAGYVCGDLIVAENRAAPARRIRLHFIRFVKTPAATTATIYLDGGPGGDGQGILSYVAFLGRPFLDGLMVHGDFLVLGQRGTSKSLPYLVCDDPDCGGLGAQHDLASYNTAENADDVDDLRAALGLDRLDLYGISYGSRLGLEVLRRHGLRVNVAVIEGLVPAQTVWTAAIPKSFHGALTALDASCRAAGACGAAYGDLVAGFLAGVDALDQEPVAIDLDGDEVFLDGGGYASVLFRMMYSRSSYPWLPLLIHDLAERRVDRVNDFIAAWAARGPSTVARGLYFSVVCGELYDPPRPDAFEAANVGVPARFVELFGGSYFGLLDFCQGWPTRGVQQALAQPVASSVRTLVSSGALDPITPPSFGTLAASTLTDAVTVVHANSGHGATLQSPCGTQHLLDFLRDPTALLDTSCAGEITTAYLLPSTVAAARVPRERIRLDAALVPEVPFFAARAHRRGVR